jgi:hypothetical protein
MTVPTFTFGKIPVEAWEYPAIVLVILIASIAGSQVTRKYGRTDPSWRYFLPGLWLKIGGGIFFSLIYLLYYRGGDTTSYYECSLAFVNLLLEHPLRFFEAYAGGGTIEIKSLFTAETGSPMGYMFFEDKARMVIKLCVPFLLISGKSYLLSTVLLSIVTYFGLWRLYRMFVAYFPAFYRNLALAILFMPSVIFWGSGILKDSFTLAATCYFIVATNNLITGGKRKLLSWISLFISGFIIVAIKPYILIILLPGTFVWYFYNKIKGIRNVYFRYIMVPFVYIIILGTSYGLLTTLGDSLGRFAPEKALQTAVVIQNDLKQEYYDGASFDIGQLEATPTSLLSKFPVAVIAGLYRPFIWESHNAVMLLSGLENLFILGLTLVVLVSLKPKVIRQLLRDQPVILYSLAFAILFAFMIGVTTSNFGALVRFKIPLIPLYMAAIMIMYSHLRSFKVRKDSRRIRLFR